MLDVQHLSVAYGVTEVLRDVSFTVPERSIVALLGGNGSGKTTTLNVLSGLLAPRGGAVRFEGRSIAALPSHEIVRRGIVQVPQGREVWSGMSVRGLTILLVEQNVGVAAALAEHAHVLMNGEVALSAPAADLLRNPDVLRSYLGR